jgi:hypothetical protein
MPLCPAGHTSAATDFCDTCGRRMDAPPRVPDRPPDPVESCPRCQAPRAGRYCENCRYDFSAPAGGAAAAWAAVITADRDYFDSVQETGQPGGGVEFPAAAAAREVTLTGPQMLIGRRGSGGGAGPDIDLSGPPADAGVSHRHALLTAQPGGGWSLLDTGSANGTQLNGADVTPHVATPLHDGDRIAIGRWTVLTIRAR